MKTHLRTARENLDWSQEELARRSGVGQTTISRLELAAASMPLHQTVIALSAALQVDALELRFGPDPRKRRGPRRRREASES